MNNTPIPCMQLKNISRVYGTGDTQLNVLKDINLTLNKGEIVALTGPSGSGKSTLLHIAGLLDTPSSGNIVVNDKNIATLSDAKRTILRQSTIGFVYQSHLLLPDFNALENVMLPQLIAGISPKMAQNRAIELLQMVGLSHRLKHRSGQLSGGEQQRVAIARALANAPLLLLADEPTGNLDPKTADTVFDMLLSIVKETKMAALIATHNPELARKMDRQIHVADGIIIQGMG